MENFTTENCKKKVSNCVNVLDSSTQELQTLNGEQKQAVDDITDKILDPEKVLAS